MTTFSKAAGYGGILFAALVTATPALSGTGLHEGEGIVTKLGANASAITYWVNEPSGWHVVTTVDTKSGENADDEKHAILRFSSSLLPGQSQLISVRRPWASLSRSCASGVSPTDSRSCRFRPRWTERSE